jgi:hypothetical protein
MIKVTWLCVAGNRQFLLLEVKFMNDRLWENMRNTLNGLEPARQPNTLPEPKALPPAERETLYRLIEDVQVQAKPSEHSPAIMTLVAGEIVKMLIWQGEWVKVQFFDYLHWELTTGWTQKSSLEHLMPRMSDSPRPFRTGQEVHPSLQFLAAKLHEVGIPLGEYTKEPIYRGPRTGLNRAFVINAETREKLIAQDPASADLIRPWMRCRDLKKWQGNWANRYVLMVKPGTPLEQYPAIQQHLEPFREALETRNSATAQSNQWFEIPATLVPDEVLQRPKIIYPARPSTNRFALDDAGLIPSQKCCVIPSDDLYLLAVLNSVLVTVWSRTMLPFTENLFIAKVTLMNRLPIAPATVVQQAPIIELVKNLLSTPWTVGAIALEQEIDSLLFKLYDLTAAEIAFLTEFQRPPLCGIWADLPEFDRDD